MDGISTSGLTTTSFTVSRQLAVVVRTTTSRDTTLALHPAKLLLQTIVASYHAAKGSRKSQRQRNMKPQKRYHNDDFPCNLKGNTTVALTA